PNPRLPAACRAGSNNSRLLREAFRDRNGCPGANGPIVNLSLEKRAVAFSTPFGHTADKNMFVLLGVVSRAPITGCLAASREPFRPKGGMPGPCLEPYSMPGKCVIMADDSF